MPTSKGEGVQKNFRTDALPAFRCNWQSCGEEVFSCILSARFSLYFPHSSANKGRSLVSYCLTFCILTTLNESLSLCPFQQDGVLHHVLLAACCCTGPFILMYFDSDRWCL